MTPVRPSALRSWPPTVDEVQRVPELVLAVKAAVDAQQPRQTGQFVLTGSANLLALQRIGDSLAGASGVSSISRR